MTRTARPPALALLAAVCFLAGCAQVPTSGPVEQGEGVQAGVDEPFIRVLPQVPTAGMSPVSVVRGFLAASASFDGDHAVARDYLTPAAAASWDASAGVVVYDDEARFSLRSTGRRAVELRASIFATIDRDGSLTPRRDTSLTRAFTLRRAAGEWRIVDPPRGLYLTRLDVERSYRALDLFFLAPRSPFLVPDPVYVPVVRPGAATSLVRALLDGPTPWLAPAVRTAFPPRTGLVVDSVPVENGVAQVDLTSEVLQAGEADLAALTAQLVWTLAQLPEVTGVQLSAEGVPLTTSSSTGVQTTQDWAGFDPNAAPTGLTGVGVIDGALVQLAGEDPQPVPGPLGDGSLRLRTPAVTWSNDRTAAVSEDGTTVYVQQQAQPTRAARVYSGVAVATPSFDGAGDLWLVDQRRTGSRVLLVPPDAASTGGARVLRVDTASLRGRTVQQLRVARDGTRVALVLASESGGGELVLARVVRTRGGVELDGLRPLERTLTDVQSVAWATSDRIVVLAQEAGAAVQPWVVGVDATVTPTGGSLPGAVDLAAAPQRPLLAATGDGRVWEDTGLSWREVARATDPAYAG